MIFRYFHIFSIFVQFYIISYRTRCCFLILLIAFAIYLCEKILFSKKNVQTELSSHKNSNELFLGSTLPNVLIFYQNLALDIMNFTFHNISELKMPIFFPPTPHDRSPPSSCPIITINSPTQTRTIANRYHQHSTNLSCNPIKLFTTSNRA